MKITAEPRSDQWNADDFVGSKAKVFTIAKVIPGKAEQKYDIELTEGEGRVWRPPITVIRILLDAWGDESDDWVGRRVALYREPSVTFGKEKTGGIRISHMSHLPNGAPLIHKSTVSRGRRGEVTIKPLPDAPPTITNEQAAEIAEGISQASDHDELNAIAAQLKTFDLAVHRDPLFELWKARIAELENPQIQEPGESATTEGDSQ